MTPRSLVRIAAAFAALAVACAGPPARAQSLQRLTITRFTLASDTATPTLEVPFHLLIVVRVRERVGELDTLDLPVLTSLELLGDERHLSSDASGTLYRETITVVAHHTGSITIDPATLDAIDARDGKAKRYFSNPLTLTVRGGALAPLRSGGAALLAGAVFVLRVAVVLAGLLCAVAIVALLFRRKSVPAPMPAQPVAPRFEPPRDPRDDLRDALVVLRAEPTRANAMLARSHVRATVGATDDETLADVLARAACDDPAMALVLRNLERAAFTYDADLQAAIAAAVDSLEHAIA